MGAGFNPHYHYAVGKLLPFMTNKMMGLTLPRLVVFANNYLLILSTCLILVRDVQYSSRRNVIFFSLLVYQPGRTIGRAPDSKVRGPGFDTQSCNILSFLLLLFQEGQLSVTGESMCTKYWSTAKEV